MPPKSNAERQKKYREKLKNENPSKYEEMRIKHINKVKENMKKKKESLTDEQKEELREKWRKANAQRAKIKNESKNNIPKDGALKVRNKTKELKEKLQRLIEQNTQLKRRNKNLRQACNRMKRRMDVLKKLNQQNRPTEEIEIPENSLRNDTPLTKSNSFVEETIPNISKEEKEKVKKKLLLLNTITESLKTEFNKADPNEKKVLKKIATNEIVNKHKLKTEISHALGLKGRIRITRTRKEIIKKYKKEIQDFFEREDVSRPSAGKNECITRNKQKIQKRYLLKPVYLIYRQYRAEGGRASLQTFYRFQPFSIVKSRVQDRNTCACIKHCNLSFMAISLKKLGLLKTTDIDELMKEVTCSKCFKCMYSECSECKNKNIDIDLKVNEDSPVQWLKWVLGTHNYTKIAIGKSEIKQTKKYTKQKVEGTVGTLIKEFQDYIQKFKIHYYNVSHQYLAWKKCIANLDEDEAALICDFSENYACKHAEEIQAVHFGASRNQVTLHTSVLYRKNVKPQSLCSISPSNEHGPGAIWAHLEPIMKLCKDLNIKKIHIFSDSPATQYRQKNNFYMFQKNIKDYAFEYATWNFFEASHGKGPADGVGGALKRKLDNHISHGNDITDAKEAFEYLKWNSNVTMFYVNENDIQEMTRMIPDNIIPIKGTMKLHQISTDGKPQIKYKWLSCFDCEKNICCDCYYKKEHTLVKANAPTEQKIIPSGRKRQSKKRNLPAKRCKRINSSTTTESDVSISYCRDSESGRKGEEILQINKTKYAKDSSEYIRGQYNLKQNFKTEEHEQHSPKKEEEKTQEPSVEEAVTMLSSSRFMPENCAFYNTEVESLTEGMATVNNETYTTLQDKEKAKSTSKEKKTIKRQEYNEKENFSMNSINVQTYFTDNQRNNETEIHEEEPTNDIDSLPVIFLDNFDNDEVVIGDFSFEELDNKYEDIEIENNNDIEDNTGYKINIKKSENIENNTTNESKRGTSGPIILKVEEKLEKKVRYKNLKPVSPSNCISISKAKIDNKKNVNPKELRKKFNYTNNSEEIYKALMDSD